jgi:hypothetical protein
MLLAVPAISQQAPSSEEEPLVTDRPDFTESPLTVPAHRSQLEAGYTLTHGGGDTLHTLGEFLLRIGLSKKTELRVGLNSYGIQEGVSGTGNGFQDLNLGFKWVLREAKEGKGLRNPQIALIGGLSFPTGGAPFRAQHIQPQFKLCLGWELTDRLALASNINSTVVSEGGSQFHQFSGSVSFGYTLTDKVASYFEWFAFLPGAFGAGNSNFLNGGFTYLVNNDLQLDLRVGVGLNGVREDYFVGFGVSKRW